MITRTDFDLLRPELLNPNMQVFAAWRKKLQDALCECPEAHRQRYNEHGWIFDTDNPSYFTSIAWRIDPSWAGPEEPVAKKEEDRPAKIEEYEDLPVWISGGELPSICLGVLQGWKSVSDVQAHPRFAGIMDHNGKIYLSWHDYAAHNSSDDNHGTGYRIEMPKAVRLWKEVKP